jgi:predicted PurR-regulated permease PerM
LFMLFVGSVIFLFMLLHGERYQAWVVSHGAFSPAVIGPLVHDSASAIRGYFRGTTILALTNAVPVGLTAWLLDIPLVGAIAMVTFITAYVPFFGAIVGRVRVSDCPWQPGPPHSPDHAGGPAVREQRRAELLRACRLWDVPKP